MRVYAYDGGGNRGDEEGAVVVEDVHPILPQVLLPDKSRRKAQAELLSGFVRESIVRVYVVLNEWG